jgi:hypothetical protein
LLENSNTLESSLTVKRINKRLRGIIPGGESDRESIKKPKAKSPIAPTKSSDLRDTQTERSIKMSGK